MTKAQRIAAAWAALDARALTEQVRLLVKAGDGDARAVWAAVSADPVLIARVRGALSGLKAEFRGHRDESMWLLWITRTQQHLVAPPKAPVVAAVEPEPEVEEAPLRLEQRAATVERPRPAIPGLLFQEPLPNAG